MLRDNVAAPVPWARVAVLVIRVDANTSGGIPFETRTVMVNRLVRTDTNGTVAIPDLLADGTYIVRLEFPGDGELAPYETRFLYTVKNGPAPIP